MADTPSRWIEIHILGSGESFDCCILGQIFLGFILNIVVESENSLLGIEDASCADSLESEKRVNQTNDNRRATIGLL
jgi:hypothetical protein